ncbi:transcription factor subunit Med10 of mediator complex-domain-containing protein [Lentinula novae-zelandiae]|nr:transcription factor subunit Med10 of mediator complex-domain-containing protein [Lentinula novae-zelandiae]
MVSPQTPGPAPDSPRSSQSPVPEGHQGNLELELLGLANALYNLGTTVINDSTKERDKPGGGKQVGLRVNQVVQHLNTVDNMALDTRTMIPMQILTDIDNARNPMQLTRERLERTATENQFMNGKIAAIASYRDYLNEALCQNFPELEELLRPASDAVVAGTPSQLAHEIVPAIAESVPNGSL